MNNLWILTEERPKANVIQIILEKIATDYGFLINIDDAIKIEPVIKNNCFTFIYKVFGASSTHFESIYIKIASGNSSFVDFLIFMQKEEPNQESTPVYAIEETKTDDSESRNTGIYQRCSKFVYVDFYYPGIKKIMLYNLQIVQKEHPTETNVFGMRMLETIGVEVLGKIYDHDQITAFKNLQELVDAKNSMNLPRSSSNVPIRINILADKITISGRLYKAGGIGHDPNIGALTIIALCIRKWEKHKPVVITQHGLAQENLGRGNKFIQIAKRLDIRLDGLVMPSSIPQELYWHYDNSQEKIASIFLHVIIVAFTNAEVIYANHGGSERGYFLDKNKGPIAIEKYQAGKRGEYKSGDKTMIIHIPDMIVFDPKRNIIINIEGKKYSTRKQGVTELDNYSYIEENIIRPSHFPKKIIRTVVIFGSHEKKIVEPQISFLLNEDGEILLGKKAPDVFKEALELALRSQDI